MKKNNAKSAKTVSKEVKKVAPKKTVAAAPKKPAAPVIDANKVRLMQKTIDDYKMTVGLLEQKVVDLKAANLKAKKRIAALNEKLAKKKELYQVREAYQVVEPQALVLPKVAAAPSAPISPFSPQTSVADGDVVRPTLSTPQVQPAIAIPPVSPDFIKSCTAVRY